jgi:hypothetical protein
MNGYDGFVRFGISGTAALVCLGAALAFALLPKFAGIKWARASVLPLIMSGVAGVALVAFGGFTIAGLTSGGMAALARGVGRFAPGLVYAVPILIGLAALLFFVHHTWAININKWGLIAAIATPLTLGFVPGKLGEVAVALVGCIPWTFTWLFTTLLGAV